MSSLVCGSSSAPVKFGGMLSRTLTNSVATDSFSQFAQKCSPLSDGPRSVPSSVARWHRAQLASNACLPRATCSAENTPA